MKAYVILQKGFEYNDEVYTEGEGGNPKIVCFFPQACELRGWEVAIGMY